MGAQFADYASDYPLQAGVLAADRVSPHPGRRSLLRGPFGPEAGCYHGRYGSRYWGQTPCQATQTTPSVQCW
jgi:hypothetical protein